METERRKNQKLNAGDRKLKKFMEEGEVFITNAPVHSFGGPMGPRSGQEIVSAFLKSGGYSTVRIVEHAFDVNGNPVPGHVAIVGIRKATPSS